jgi:ribonuclease VapC
MSDEVSPAGELGYVLDASAALAFLHREPGWAQVASRANGAILSAINWSEVLQKALDRGIDEEGTRSDLQDLGVTLVPVSEAEATLAAHLWIRMPRSGLSLADRICLATAMVRGLPVLTADRSWPSLPLNGLEVRLIR